MYRSQQCTESNLRIIPSLRPERCFFTAVRNHGRVANDCIVTEESGREKQRMVIGWERGNESMEGPAILAYSASLSCLVCRLFFPLFFVLGLLITSLSPLHCIPHSFVILPRKRIRELSLSHHTFPLSPSAFLCLCLLVVRPAPYCLSTLHFDPLRPMMSHREQGLLGSWEVTRGRTCSCPVSISAI